MNEKSTFKVHTNVGGSNIFDGTISKSIEGLPVTLLSLPRHENPSNRDIYFVGCIKYHDDEALIERNRHNGECGIKKDLDLSIMRNNTRQRGLEIIVFMPSSITLQLGEIKDHSMRKKMHKSLSYKIVTHGFCVAPALQAIQYKT